MKNIKLNVKKAAKAGFSLVEMLVVIAIIGVIAAIAIPNIGSVNDSAKLASAQRNAQSVCSLINSAIAAGVPAATVAAGVADLVGLAEGTTLSPTEGAFNGKVFTIGAIEAEDQSWANMFLGYDATNNQVTNDTSAAKLATVRAAIEAR